MADNRKCRCDEDCGCNSTGRSVNIDIGLSDIAFYAFLAFMAWLCLGKPGV